MHSDLYERCAQAMDALVVPEFPRTAIRTAAAHVLMPQPNRRPWTATIAAALSLAAVAATAAVVARSQIHFTNSGGMVLTSKHATNRAISSPNEIMDAAKQMNFAVTLPAGLPAGSVPIRLYVGDDDVMAITYNLPGAWRASHHLAWVFLSNPAAISSQRNESNYRLSVGGRMSSARWRSGAEEVVVVSNGLTRREVDTMKTAMHGH